MIPMRQYNRIRQDPPSKRPCVECGRKIRGPAPKDADGKYRPLCYKCAKEQGLVNGGESNDNE